MESLGEAVGGDANCILLFDTLLQTFVAFKTMPLPHLGLHTLLGLPKESVQTTLELIELVTMSSSDSSKSNHHSCYEQENLPITRSQSHLVAFHKSEGESRHDKLPNSGSNTDQESGALTASWYNSCAQEPGSATIQNPTQLLQLRRNEGETCLERLSNAGTLPDPQQQPGELEKSYHHPSTIKRLLPETQSPIHPAQRRSAEEEFWLNGIPVVDSTPAPGPRKAYPDSRSCGRGIRIANPVVLSSNMSVRVKQEDLMKSEDSVKQVSIKPIVIATLVETFLLFAVQPLLFADTLLCLLLFAPYPNFGRESRCFVFCALLNCYGTVRWKLGCTLVFGLLRTLTRMDWGYVWVVLKGRRCNNERFGSCL